MIRTRVLLFTLVWLSCVWFGSWAMNPNNATRLFAAMSLVEQHDASIDEYRGLTIDEAQFNGHAFLDKAPGMTLLALPAVALADAIDPAPPVIPATIHDRAFEHYMLLRLRLSVMLVSALLTALAALAMLDLGERLTGSRGAGLFAAIGFALGTPVWGWSTTLFGHAPVASLFVIAVWALWRADAGQKRFTAIGGAALGLAVLIEFQAVLAGAMIAAWGAWRLQRAGPLVIAASAGVAALLIPFVAYNLVAFGVPFRLGYSGVVGFAGMKEGLFGLTVPKLHVLWEILFGQRRGLAWVAPILLLGVPGLWLLGRVQRGLALALAAAVMVVLLVNAAYVYWDGGHSTGPRHAVPAVGLLAIGLAPLWANLRHGWERGLALALLAVSVAINLMIAGANITAPDTYPFPLADPILPSWRAGLLRTLPSDYWGWRPIAGAWLYLAIALPLAALLLASMRRSSKTAVAT